MTEFTIEEEVAEEEAPEKQDAEQADEQAEADSIDAVATELGWRPDGELDAKSFILKSRDIQDTMKGHMKDQKKQLSELSTVVAELKTHNEKVFKAEVSKLKSELETLKKEKKEAIEEGDVDRVDQLDEQIDGVKEAMSTPKKSDTPVNPEFDAWVTENPWYKTDPEMAAYADTIADQFAGAPFNRVLARVKKETMAMFPDKFDPPKKQQSVTPSPVEGSGKRIAASKFTEADLTESQKSIMGQFVRQKIMTKAQYIADIAKTQGA